MLRNPGGKLQRLEGQGAKFKTGYYVYHPSGDVDPVKPRPLLFLIDPSGNPMRYLLRHIEAAEQTKITAISAEYFRNRRDLDDLHARFEDLIPIIGKDVPYEPQHLYLGGTSGGGWAPFTLPPVCKSTGGGHLLKRRLARPKSRRRNTLSRVSRCHGQWRQKDFAVAGEVEKVTRNLQKRGCTVSLFAFKGGHQIPLVSVQNKTFRWLIEETK